MTQKSSIEIGRYEEKREYPLRRNKRAPVVVARTGGKNQAVGRSESVNPW